MMIPADCYAEVALNNCVDRQLFDPGGHGGGVEYLRERLT